MIFLLVLALKAFTIGQVEAARKIPVQRAALLPLGANWSKVIIGPGPDSLEEGPQARLGDPQDWRKSIRA